MPDTDADHAGEPPQHTSRYDPLAWDAVRVITVVVLVCVAVTVGALVIYLTTSATTDRGVKECLQRQVAQLQGSYIAGREAAKQDRQSQRELLLAQLAAPAEGRAAVERYLQRLDESDRARTANPPPTQNCL